MWAFEKAMRVRWSVALWYSRRKKWINASGSSSSGDGLFYRESHQCSCIYSIRSSFFPNFSRVFHFVSSCILKMWVTIRWNRCKKSEKNATFSGMINDIDIEAHSKLFMPIVSATARVRHSFMHLVYPADNKTMIGNCVIHLIACRRRDDLGLQL